MYETMHKFKLVTVHHYICLEDKICIIMQLQTRTRCTEQSKKNLPYYCKHSTSKHSSPTPPPTRYVQTNPRDSDKSRLAKPVHPKPTPKKNSNTSINSTISIHKIRINFNPNSQTRNLPYKATVESSVELLLDYD